MVDLVLRQNYSVADPAGAARAVQAVFGAGSVTAAPGAFRYEQRSLVDDGVSVTRITSRGAGVRASTPGSADLVVVHARAGMIVLLHGGTRISLRPGDLGLISVGQRSEIAWDEMSADLFSFPVSSFGRVLGSTDGDILVRAPYLTPRSAEVAALWIRLADMLAGQVLDQPVLYERDVIRAQLIDALTAVTVEAFGLTNGREDAEDRDEEVVARAETFMRTRLNESITVPEVAASAGVSIRALQLSYQRRAGTTPVSRLRQLRIEGARAILVNAVAGTTVGAVGRRFGYSNLGRFSAHYRAEYDESPSQTLDRVRAGEAGDEPARGPAPIE